MSVTSSDIYRVAWEDFRLGWSCRNANKFKSFTSSATLACIYTHTHHSIPSLSSIRCLLSSISFVHTKEPICTYFLFLPIFVEEGKSLLKVDHVVDEGRSLLKMEGKTVEVAYSYMDRFNLAC